MKLARPEYHESDSAIRTVMGTARNMGIEVASREQGEGMAHKALAEKISTGAQARGTRPYRLKKPPNF